MFLYLLWLGEWRELSSTALRVPLLLIHHNGMSHIKENLFCFFQWEVYDQEASCWSTRVMCAVHYKTFLSHVTFLLYDVKCWSVLYCTSWCLNSWDVSYEYIFKREILQHLYAGVNTDCDIRVHHNCNFLCFILATIWSRWKSLK